MNNLLVQNEVFADVINVLLFNGEKETKPEELKTFSITSHRKIQGDEEVTFVEEVTKFWSKNAYFSIRVINNDGWNTDFLPVKMYEAMGRNYLDQMETSEQPCIVIPIVLHFGTEEKWDGPCSIKECMDVSEDIAPFINNFEFHLFDIAWLSDEQLGMFTSDFGKVADFFVKKRKNPEHFVNKHMEDDVVYYIKSIYTSF